MGLGGASIPKFGLRDFGILGSWGSLGGSRGAGKGKNLGSDPEKLGEIQENPEKFGAGVWNSQKNWDEVKKFPKNEEFGW